MPLLDVYMFRHLDWSRYSIFTWLKLSKIKCYFLKKIIIFTPPPTSEVHFFTEKNRVLKRNHNVIGRELILSMISVSLTEEVGFSVVNMVRDYKEKIKSAYNFRFDKWTSSLLGNKQIPRTKMCTTQKTCSSHLNINTVVWSSLQISLLVLLEASLLLPVQTVHMMWNIIGLGRYFVLLTWHVFFVWFRSITPHLAWSYPREWKLLQLKHSSVPLMAYLLSQGSQGGSRWWFMWLLQNGRMNRK